MSKEIGRVLLILGGLLLIFGFAAFFYTEHLFLTVTRPYRDLGIAFIVSSVVTIISGGLFSRTPKGTFKEVVDFPVRKKTRSRSSHTLGTFLIVFGATILTFVGWLTWYDITVWVKDVASIYLGSRVGEAISLGIGLKVIHYLLLGLALLVSGTVSLSRTK